MSSLTMHIIGQHLPGRQFCKYDAVHVTLQGKTREDLSDLVPGDAPEARFTMTVQVSEGDARDFRGPCVQGKRGERFVYLSWGQLHPDGQFQMFRRAKIFFADVPSDEVTQALDTGAILEGRLSLTSDDGGPLCARVRPPRITWQIAPTNNLP